MTVDDLDLSHLTRAIGLGARVVHEGFWG